MKILRIFQKDVRHLWPHIAVYLSLLIAAAVLDPVYTASRYSGPHDVLSNFVGLLACWNLLIAVIHEEKLPGDRQYWLTRPFSWWELLASKALFVAVWVQLPIFLYQAGVLASVGIPLGEHLSTLLWRQFFLAAFWILPIAVVAAITRSLGQVILVWLMIVIPLRFAQSFLFSIFRVHWIGGAEASLTLAIAIILAVAVPAILLLQYSRRATGWSRLALAALALVLIATVFGGDRTLRAAAQPREMPGVRLSLDTTGDRKSNVMPSGRPDQVTIDVPVRLDGVPPDVDLIQNSMSVWIGARQKLELPAQGGLQRVVGNLGWLTIYVQRGYYDMMVAGRPVSLYGSVNFTAFEPAQEFPLPHGHRVVVPRVGSCVDLHDSLGISFACYTPFPRAAVSIGTPESHRNWIIPHGFATDPLPVESGIEPLARYTSQLPFRNWDAVGQARLFVARPLPPVQVRFEFAGVRLDRSVIPNPR